MSEDPVYGTPIFMTMGGQSKCPGETLTSRRESAVTVFDIVPRCGATKNLPCTDLAPGTTASFGLVILNLSPTGMRTQALHIFAS